MGKKCAICGNASGMYPLCVRCFQLRDQGLVLKCEKCGQWHLKDKPCDCIDEIEEEFEDPFEPQIQSTACLICNNESNGYLFCKSCYGKYKNKEILLKITNCEQFEILDDSYKGRYTCDDGHIVKSMAEREIDDFLFKNNIPHAYEIKYPIDKNPDHDIHPDFYLPNEDIYIEHWGMDNEKYNKAKEYKMEIYKRDKVTLICTYAKDLMDINASLKRKLKFYNKNEINE